jgi:hypothetical protein
VSQLLQMRHNLFKKVSTPTGPTAQRGHAMTKLADTASHGRYDRIGALSEHLIIILLGKE